MNVAEFLVEYSARLGVSSAFCLSGGMAMHLNRALEESGKLSVVYTHHEQAAVCAAEGYSKANNFLIPGLACVTAGPGASNSLTGLLSAFADSTPVIILGGQVKSEDIGGSEIRTHGIQEIRSKEIISPAVKYFHRFAEGNYRDQIKTIHRNLNVGRKGPVYIEVPLDVQAASIPDAEEILNEIFSVKQMSEVAQVIDSSVLIRVQELIVSASRIGVYLGNGVRIAGLEIEPLLQFLDERKIPRFYSWLSQDLEDFSSESNLNSPGSLAPIYSNVFLQEADLVFFIGARLDLATTAFQRKSFGGSGARVFIDIDENELNKLELNHRDIPVQYDLSLGLEWLIKLLTDVSPQEEWCRKFTQAKKNYLEDENKYLQGPTYSTRDLALDVSRIVNTGTIVMSSSGYAAEGIARFFRPNGKNRFFHGGGLGSMGQGLSHGIGAIVSRKSFSEPVWILESDGGLWMNAHELATLSNLKAENTVLLIMNNHGYASIYNSQERHFGKHYGTNDGDGLLFPNWELICKSVNLDYVKLKKLEPEHIASFLESGRTLVIEVELPTQESRGPALKTVMTTNGPTTQEFQSISW
jgi:acetolactate synthase I/II/III large subunit